MKEARTLIANLYRVQALSLCDYARWFSSERDLRYIPWDLVERAHADLTRLLAKKPRKEAA